MSAQSGRPVNSSNIKRGEIWLVNLDPTVGSEIRKTRPAVVVSSDAVGILPVKLVAPVTGWQTHFAENIWHIRIEPEPTNGLQKTSAVDVLQLRGVDTRRFTRRMGVLLPEQIKAITYAIAIVTEFDG